MLRLRLFSAHLTSVAANSAVVYEPHPKALDLKPTPDVLSVVQGALLWRTTQTYVGTLAAYRKQLLTH